ncbi:hypothetical protein [Cohaesibacter intestini]|uniref:hypothetical protein n=1 Tax=Cohaesibacter intestini TaxID=2211145 RepID=UPI000DEBF112|nr:hypothetical protein [Cohaesibacter intestini]
MKAIAVALPLLVATLIGGPASARPIDLTAMNGQLVISIGKAEQVRHYGWDQRKAVKHHGKQRRFEPLPPRKIARILNNRGFTGLRNMRTDGRVYTVKARGKRGNLVRLTVNARNGKIIDRQLLRRLNRVDRRANDHSARWDYRNDRRPFWIR